MIGDVEVGRVELPSRMLPERNVYKLIFRKRKKNAAIMSASAAASVRLSIQI